MPRHPSHVTRFSWDPSTYDEVCVNCGATLTCYRATDEVPGGWGELANPCPHPNDSRKADIEARALQAAFARQ